MTPLEQQLKEKFLEEAGQLLVDAEQCFLNLEKNPGDRSLVDKIFRLAHNLKGGAKAVGFQEIGAFAHVFESFILKIKRDEIPKSAPVIGVLLRCNDFLLATVASLRGNLDAKIDPAAITADLESFLGGKSVPAAAVLDDQAIQDAIDRQFALKDAVQPVAAEPEGEEPTAEEIAALLACDAPPVALVAPVLVKPPVAEARDFGPMRDAPLPAASVSVSKDESIRVSLNRLDRLLDFVGEMVILQTMLRDQIAAEKSSRFTKTVQQIGKVTKEMQDITLSLRMVPVKQTFMKMQRIVRDTGVTLNKKVRLHLEGEDTEIDKTVLEHVSDPLVHLVRNAMDHGIETPEARRAAGKPEEGNLYLKATHQGGKLVMELRDDGAGIDAASVRKRAIERGLIGADQTLTQNEIFNLIFRPGFSTKAEITEVSGRGVGLDVVKSNIDALQGEVLVETQAGAGTCFRVVLPLTLAIIEGMIVRCGDERFVIPLSQVYESVSPRKEDVQFNADLCETLTLRDECMPLVRLSHTLGRKIEKPAWDCIAIVVRNAERPFAILVDDILGQQQIVIKKLGVELQRLRAFSGTAVLGDGKPALIIETNEIAAIAKPVRRQELDQWRGVAA
jgi:two-component system chemotaxis sensor kinase CheA